MRRVTPERREQLPLEINWHSVKNRFLMRGKNASGFLCWKLFWPVVWRDLMVVGYALLRDWRLLSAVFIPCGTSVTFAASEKSSSHVVAYPIGT